MDKKNKHLGSSFDSFLQEEKLLKSSERVAKKRVKQIRKSKRGKKS